MDVERLHSQESPPRPGSPATDRSIAATAMWVAVAGIDPRARGPAVRRRWYTRTSRARAGCDLRLFRFFRKHFTGREHPAVISATRARADAVDRAAIVDEHRTVTALVVSHHEVTRGRARRREEQPSAEVTTVSRWFGVGFDHLRPALPQLVDVGIVLTLGPPVRHRATMGPMIHVMPAAVALKPVLRRLVQLYAYDFSEFTDQDIGDDGA